MNRTKSIIVAVVILFLLSACGSGKAGKNKDICRISEEQKLYELSLCMERTFV